MAASFLAELVAQRCGDRDGEMLETLLHVLMTSLSDSAPLVRRAALRGLSFIFTFPIRSTIFDNSLVVSSPVPAKTTTWEIY